MRSGARANVLMGVASARIDIKQAAGRAETLLERYSEPLSALHLAPESWPAPFLALAWRKVVENSAHDSICGCSIDPGRQPGPRPVRRGGADRRGTLSPRGRCDCRLRCPAVPWRSSTPRRCRGPGSSRPSCWCPRSGSRSRSSCPTEAASPPRSSAARSRSCSTSRCGATRSTTCSVASTVERCSTTHGTATGSMAAR